MFCFFLLFSIFVFFSVRVPQFYLANFLFGIFFFEVSPLGPLFRGPSRTLHIPTQGSASSAPQLGLLQAPGGGECGGLKMSSNLQQLKHLQRAWPQEQMGGTVVKNAISYRRLSLSCGCLFCSHTCCSNRGRSTFFHTSQPSPRSLGPPGAQAPQG